MIKSIQHKNDQVCAQIYAVFQAAYKVEAQIIGAEIFPPLARTVQQIQDATSQFYGFFDGAELAAVIEVDSNLPDLMSNSDDALSIESLTVHPQYFKKGIASKLIEIVLRNNHFKTAFVETASDNKPAIKLYEKQGFTIYNYYTPSHGIEKVALRLEMA